HGCLNQVKEQREQGEVSADRPQEDEQHQHQPDVAEMHDPAAPATMMVMSRRPPRRAYRCGEISRAAACVIARWAAYFFARGRNCPADWWFAVIKRRLVRVEAARASAPHERGG